MMEEALSSVKFSLELEPQNYIGLSDCFKVAMATGDISLATSVAYKVKDLYGSSVLLEKL